MNDNRAFAVGYGAVATAMAALLVYAAALHNGFAFDDVVLVSGDPRVLHTRIGALITKPYWNDSALALWRPLTSVTFALDWLVATGSAAWFHFTNVLWHMLASLGAYLLLARYFRPAAALAGGIAFALHPVHVEAVANVVGRAELIAATFFFAACLVWTARELPPQARLLLTLLCYMLAMLAKESAAVLPAVLFVIDDDATRNWRNYAFLALALALFLFLRFEVIGGFGPSRVDPSLEVATAASQRMLTALYAWPEYLRLLFFPRTLLADYGPRILLPVEAWNSRAVIGLTLVTATVAGGLVALVTNRKRWALGLLWFPITILPVSNFLFPIGVLVAERTLYLPSFAACFLFAVLFEAIPNRRYAIAVCVAVGLAFAAKTIARIPTWKSTDTVMATLLRDRPDSFRAQWHMARLARQRGDVQAALQRYDLAMKLWPYREGLVQEAAAYGGSQGRAAWARDLAFWGTRRWPQNANFYRMLAAHAIDLGDTTVARQAVRNGLRRHPSDQILNDMQNAFGK